MSLLMVSLLSGRRPSAGPGRGRREIDADVGPVGGFEALEAQKARAVGQAEQQGLTGGGVLVALEGSPGKSLDRRLRGLPRGVLRRRLWVGVRRGGVERGQRL